MLDSAADLKRLLQGSGVLEYHILVTEDEMGSDDARAMAERLQHKGHWPRSGDDMRLVRKCRNARSIARIRAGCLPMAASNTCWHGRLSPANR